LPTPRPDLTGERPVLDWHALDDLASVPVEPDETEAETAARAEVDIRLFALLAGGRLSSEEQRACYRT
jgi:hypothetical protein